jgi:GntR family transcriptional regulator/MocR family aminotransferase
LRPSLAREAPGHHGPGSPAQRRGVVIEPGAVHFLNQPGPANFCRLGVSSIPTERIEPGIKLLAEAVREATA